MVVGKCLFWLLTMDVSHFQIFQVFINYLDCRVIALIPDESEDMWHAFNLISEGDSVTASTVRKVQTESATGSSTSSRVRTTLTIQVETIDFDTQACVLRLKGRNIVENQYVKVIFFSYQLSLSINTK